MRAPSSVNMGRRSRIRGLRYGLLWVIDVAKMSLTLYVTVNSTFLYFFWVQNDGWVIKQLGF